MIRFSCACGRQLQARDEDVGRDAVCPICGRQQVVPRQSVLRGAREVPLDARRPAGPRRASGEARADLPELAEPPTCGTARTSFVLGLSSLVFNLFTGIPAVLLGLVALVRIRRGRPPLRGTGLAGWGIATGLIGTFVLAPLVLGFTWAVWTGTVDDMGIIDALGLPQFGPGVEDPEVANREASLDNLEDLAEALRSHMRQHNHLPPAALTDPAGKPLLSWRVAILPYLNDPDAAELYREFKLDEPWDGPNNKKLLARMPDYFALPGRDAPPGYTHYQVVVGPGSAFEDPRGQRSEDFTDPLEDTFLVVEAATAVPWTKPEDLSWTPNGPLPAFGRHYDGGFHAAFANGSADYIPPGTTARTLRGMITRNGGEDVLWP
jgi:hypothetical protein